MQRYPDKLGLGCGGTILLVWLTVGTALVYVAIHYIRKFW